MISKDNYVNSDKDKLYKIECPNCENKFLTADFTYHKKFTCVKCGSDWYAGLEMK